MAHLEHFCSSSCYGWSCRTRASCFSPVIFPLFGVGGLLSRLVPSHNRLFLYIYHPLVCRRSYISVKLSYGPPSSCSLFHLTFLLLAKLSLQVSFLPKHMMQIHNLIAVFSSLCFYSVLSISVFIFHAPCQVQQSPQPSDRANDSQSHTSTGNNIYVTVRVACIRSACRYAFRIK